MYPAKPQLKIKLITLHISQHDRHYSSELSLKEGVSQIMLGTMQRIPLLQASNMCSMIAQLFQLSSIIFMTQSKS